MLSDMLTPVSMKIKEFMEKRGLKPEDLARMFGCSLMSVYRYINGKPPSAKYMARIVHETGGLVGISDLITDKASTIQDS